jgi:D-3-phosphoglycerate dehydrogenase
MRRGSVLVNVARGGVVDEAAVAEALHDGHLASAAFDVYGSEPLVEDSPLRGAPNLVLTPHLGASTAEAQLRVAREISEALRDALLKGDLTSAVNAPSVGGDELIRMMPFMALGSRLGTIAAALAPKGPRALEIRMHADEGETGRRVLAGSVLTGFLGHILGRGTVNLVNAFHLAEQRGLEIRITRVTGSNAPRMRVEVEGESGTVEVQGGLLAEREHPRLLAIDEHALSVIPEGTLVVIRNSDVPGVIGRVGTLLGEHGINIAGYNQSRRAQGGEALAALTVDGPLPENALSSLRALDGISDVRSVTFSD